jgi:hypothetical protein
MIKKKLKLVSPAWLSETIIKLNCAAGRVTGSLHCPGRAYFFLSETHIKIYKDRFPHSKGLNI